MTNKINDLFKYNIIIYVTSSSYINYNIVTKSIY